MKACSYFIICNFLFFPSFSFFVSGEKERGGRDLNRLPIVLPGMCCLGCAAWDVLPGITPVTVGNHHADLGPYCFAYKYLYICVMTGHWVSR